VFVNKQPQGTVTVSGLGIGDVRVVAAPPLPRRAVTASAGATAITSPLPGTVAAVRVAEGDTVEPGQLLLLLEAMKMEHRITATASGTVKRVAVRHGDQVREGDLLIEVG
jgi:biotin carboxyl carrier protein